MHDPWKLSSKTVSSFLEIDYGTVSTRLTYTFCLDILYMEILGNDI